MATGLIDIMKRAALDASDAAKFADLRYGTVVSVNPLKVQITNQFSIPESMLIVPKHLTNYTIECLFEQPYQSLSGTTGISDTLSTETDKIKNHTHPVTLSSSGSSQSTSITLKNALKVGDKVALLRQQGGQSYFILDKI